MKKILIAMLFIASQVFAAESQYSEPANSSSLTGVYKLIDLPEENQPKFFKSNPWPSKCQFFGIYKIGYFLHQETHLGACENLIPQKIPVSAQEVKWKLVQKGILSLERKDGKLPIQYWKVDKILSDSHFGNINLNKGDLIMQLIGPENKPIWVRMLRKVSTA